MHAGIKTTLVRVLPESCLLHLSAADHYLNGEPELKLVARLCPRDRVAVDVGANIGTYTYFLGRVATAVHAYEPNPALAERLTRLFPRAHVHALALSDRAGQLELRIPVHDGRVDHELGSVCQAFDEVEQTVCHPVVAVTLDGEGLADVGFIKVDAEQHELAVIRGALRTIRRWRPVVMTEVTPLLYDRPLPEVFAHLVSEGYEGWFRFEGRYRPFAEFDAERHANPALWGQRFMGGNVFLLPEEAVAARAVLERASL